MHEERKQKINKKIDKVIDISQIRLTSVKCDSCLIERLFCMVVIKVRYTIDIHLKVMLKWNLLYVYRSKSQNLTLKQIKSISNRHSYHLLRLMILVNKLSLEIHGRCLQGKGGVQKKNVTRRKFSIHVYSTNCPPM